MSVPGEVPDPDAVALATYLDPERPHGARQAAFAEIVDRHAHRLHAVCLRVLGSHADAEEAVQETFVRLARSAGRFRGDAALSTWLYRVARNVCTDRVRHDARRPQTPVADVADIADVGSDEAMARAELRVAAGDVRRALQRLDAESRLLLLLVAVDGLSYAEAARATELPVGTVKSRISRARLRLGELLSTGGEDRRPPGRATDPAARSQDPRGARAPPGRDEGAGGRQPHPPG